MKIKKIFFRFFVVFVFSGTFLVLGANMAKAITAETTATLTAASYTGAVSFMPLMTATVGGTTTGNSTFSFDCTNDGTYDATFYNISATSFTAFPCYYTSVGTYTAKVSITRGGETGSAMRTFTTTAGTTFASLFSYPNPGVYPPGYVDLTASVSGTSQGLSTYTFNCGSGFSDKTYEGYGAASLTHTCTYNSSGTYNASVSITRGGVTGKANTVVNVMNPFINGWLSAMSNTIYITPDKPALAQLFSWIETNMTGETTFQFDCTNDGIYEGETTTVGALDQAYDCSYPVVGVYTARAHLSRGGISTNPDPTITINVVEASPFSINFTTNPTGGTAPAGGTETFFQPTLTAEILGIPTRSIQLSEFYIDCTNNGWTPDDYYPFSDAVTVDPRDPGSIFYQKFFTTNQCVYPYANIPMVYTAKAYARYWNISENLYREAVSTVNINLTPYVAPDNPVSSNDRCVSSCVPSSPNFVWLGECNASCEENGKRSGYCPATDACRGIFVDIDCYNSTPCKDKPGWQEIIP